MSEPRACGWLALGLSFAVHIVLLVAFAACSPAGSPPDAGPLPIDTCVVVFEGERPRPRGTTSAGGEEASEPPAPGPTLPAFPERVTVRGLPAPPPAAAPAAFSGGMGVGQGSPGGNGVSLFQVEGRGETVVYLIDRSLSMGLKGCLGVARRELAGSLDRLPASARFQVLLYNRVAEPLQIGGRSDLLPALPEIKREAVRLVESVPPAGATDHVAALRQALLFEPQVIFLVTDADDLTPQQVRTLTELNRGRTIIHTLAFGGHDGSPLHALARANGGTYRTLPAIP